MSLTGSIIGALMALVPAAKGFAGKRALAKIDSDELMPLGLAEFSRLKDYVAALERSRQHMIAHIEHLESELANERERARHWRDETTRLLAGAHRCQHQAGLNRAMAQGQQTVADLQQAQVHYQQQAAQAQAFANYQQGLGALGGIENRCQLALHDCGMHHAEMLNRLHAQMRR
jgi:septal ring factor EnvC (AmiA/AmiB activator)